MDFTQQILENRRALVEDLKRRIEAALRPFACALDYFLATLFSGRLPADWREQWHAFVADQATKGFTVEPKSIRELEDWIEAWAKFCGLLPKHMARAAAEASDPSVASNDGYLVGWQQSASRDAEGQIVQLGINRPEANTPQLAGAPVYSGNSAPQIELAGPGPETTSSFRAKVQFALELLDKQVATWWRSPSIQGLVRSQDVGFFAWSRASFSVEGARAVIVVDKSYTAGQTAEAIVLEARNGSGPFHDSFVAFRLGRWDTAIGLAEEQQRALRQAAGQVAVLAELFIKSLASLTPAGDLIVTIGDVADNGLSWSQLWSLLPLLSLLPIGAMIINFGGRRIKLSKKLAHQLENLESGERAALFARAKRAKTDEEAAAIIERGVRGAGPQHHIATNKNWISTLRGGPWSQRFRDLFEKAGMTLEDVANKIRIPGHRGPHPEAYHREIFTRLKDATRGKTGSACRRALLDELKRIADEIATPGTKLNRLLIQ